MSARPVDPDAPDAPAQRSLRWKDILAHYPGVREEHLRTLQRFGLIGRLADAEGERHIAFADLAVIRTVYKALRDGAPFKAVLRSILASRQGQLAFDFRLDARPARVIALAPGGPPPPGEPPPAPRPAPPSQPDERAVEHFILASSLDDGSAENQPKALAAYQRALEFDPDLVPALINLANLHYARDSLIEALALYERAIRLAPDVFEGHFNLANIHHDLGRFAAAEFHYRRALALNPAYPEAHLYLAVVLEKWGKSDAARPHWKAYASLAPEGTWADLAREFSSD